MKKIITLSALLFFNLAVFAQAPEGNLPANVTPTAISTNTNGSKITGYVIDSAFTKAVEFASIALFSKTANKIVDGTVADEKGMFTVTKVADGDYRVTISFVGFTSKSLDITVEDGQDVELGIINLSSSVKALDEVTVTGQRALVEEKVDRLVYNADRDLSSKGGDASDVLRKVPMLSVDLEGNVSLQGATNIQVLINNKPSSIMAGTVADALRQIPADMIKTVEVITSPSAKYDAEGSGGIINIITKKNTLQGLNLSVDGGLGNRSSVLGLTGNYRKGKLGITLGGNGRAIYNKAQTILEQSTFQNGNTIRTNQTADAYDSGVFGQYNLGFDYELSKTQSLTGNARFGIRNFNRDQNQVSNVFTNEIASLPTRRDVYSKDLSNSIDLNLDYIKTFKPQQEFSISTQYSQNNLTNNFDANVFDASNTLANRQKNINLNTNKEYTIQSDYTTPISTNQLFEIGIKGISRQVISNYQYQFASLNSEYVIDPKRPSGALEYNQNIAAGYLSYTLTTANKYTFKLGGRYEYTDISANTQENGQITIPSYGRFVPSVNISKKLSDNTTLKFAYNQRIQRPGLQQLNPNLNLANFPNISQGDPNLKPEITDRVELGLSTYIKKTYLNISLFTRLNTDDIQQASLRSDTLAGAIVSIFQNIGKEYNYGSNVFATFTISPKWSLNLNLDVQYRFIEGLAPDITGKSVTVSNSGWRAGGRIDVQGQLGKGWASSFNFGSRGRDIALQGDRTGFIMYSMGVRKEFNNKKSSIGLSAENFLTNGMTFTSNLNSTQFKQSNTQNIYNSSIRLTFSYKIGSMKLAEKKSKSVKNDDVKND
jgi:outer membrane receptor protein involved in Fe transport